MTELTQRQYLDGVEQAANQALELLDEYPDDYDDLSECIFETVDGDQWVIYHRYYLDVLRHTLEGPQEWSVWLNEDDRNDHWSVLQAMVFDAYRNDVTAKAYHLQDDD